jgi:hypothetical protein
MIAGVPRILVFDQNNVLQDVPPDVLSVSAETVVNGGSGKATILFPRKLNKIGALAERYRVQIYLPDDMTMPWYDGRITEIDMKSTAVDGRVTAQVEGFSTDLDNALVTFFLTPGVQPNGTDNGQEDFGALMTWMLGQYLPAGYSFSGSSSIGVNVFALQADHQGLATALDQVTKAILDGSGSHWEWYCDGTAALGKVVTYQAVSVNQASPVNLDAYSDFSDYDLHVVYRGIKNMLVLYGGRDPLTGEQIWGTFQDSVSIASYGLRQGHDSRPELASQSQLQQYATAWLALNGYPVYTGTLTLKVPNSKVRAGKWLSILEPGGTLRAIRIGKSTFTFSKGRFISQTVEPTAPIPRIDQALDDASSATAATLSAIASRPADTAISNYASLISGADMGPFS